MTQAGAPGRAEVIRPGLDRIREALSLSGHPERSFGVIQVAGTNGKGSTAFFLDAVLRRTTPGPVGLFTSPHLVSPEERIRISGRKVSPETLGRLLHLASRISRSVEERLGEALSFFEEMTWAACILFRREKVRVAILEAGLGGRWDATTACPAEVSVITTVGIDHREWLGRTLVRIASEKAGIIRTGVPVVTGFLRPAARKVVLAKARREGSPVWEQGRDFAWTPAEDGRIDIGLPGLLLRGIRIGMPGSFQRDNAAVACAAAWRWLMGKGIGGDSFAAAAREGLASAVIPGRFSPLPGRGNGGAWTDGAHNPDAARVLAREIRELAAGRGGARVVALWSMLRDKDVRGFLRELSSAVEDWVVYPLAHERAAPLGDLSSALRRAGLRWKEARDFPDGWREARRWAGTGGLVLVCGSFAAVGDAFRHRAGEAP
jgi:dihydrofolate synthase / folylpolyglutamate synthase